MGFDGDIVVLHGTAPLSELALFAGPQRRRVTEERPCRGGWRIALVAHEAEPSTLGADWLQALADKTDAPAMVCTVYASGAARIQGVSRAGSWEGWLDPTSAIDHQIALCLEKITLAALNEEIEDVDAFVGQHCDKLAEELACQLSEGRPELAAAIAAWAEIAGLGAGAGAGADTDAGADAGTDADADADTRAETLASRIERHLEQRRDDAVEHLFFDLLTLIGITEVAHAAA